MNGYLLDTNAASALWDARHQDHEKIRSFLQELSASLVWISVITLAEVEYGLKTVSRFQESRQQDVRDQMAGFVYVLDIDKHTIHPCSDLRAALFKIYAPRNRKGRLTKKWVEDLCERTSGKELGIQENDIWLAAQAIQYNLIFVSDDHMLRLIEVSKSFDDPLQIVKWR